MNEGEEVWNGEKEKQKRKKEGKEKSWIMFYYIVLCDIIPEKNAVKKA